MARKPQQTVKQGRVFRQKYTDRYGAPRLTDTLYIEYYDASGVRRRESAKTTDQLKAFELLLKKQKQAAEEAPPKLLDGRDATYEDLEKLVLAYYRENKMAASERVAKKSRFPGLRSFFAGKKLSQIDRGAIKDYRRHRASKIAKGKKTHISNATINRELDVLRKGLKLAVDDELLPYLPPFPPKLKEGNVRQGFFEKHELDAIVAHLPAHLKNLAKVAYITGWRVESELLSRQWDKHVDFNGLELRLFPGEAKDRSEGRVFPLLPQLKEILLEQQAIVEQMSKQQEKDIPWVFPGRLGERLHTVQHPWETARKAANVGRKLVHDFRRTAVRNLVRAGVPRKTAMEMVGHKTEEMFRRYNIVDYKDMQDAGDKLAKYLADGILA
jgi:integrase